MLKFGSKIRNEHYENNCREKDFRVGNKYESLLNKGL